MPSNRLDRSAEYEQRFPQWARIRDALEGQDAVKRRGSLYLPKPDGMSLKKYVEYLERANFYGVLDRTLRGMTGLVFRVSPAVTLTPSTEALTTAATPQGHSLGTLLRETTKEVLSLGRFGILVDVQETLEFQPRPYLAPYMAERILRWEESFSPATGVRTVTRVVLEEDRLTIGVEQDEIWLRELFLDGGAYMVQLWRSTDSDHQPHFGEEVEGFERVGAPGLPLIRGEPLTFIPFWFFNPYDHLARADRPPMVDLADVNVAHYRNSADLEQLLHLVGSPTPYTSMAGIDAEPPQTIGAGAVWHLPEGAKVGVVEFSGASYSAFAQELKAKEDRMAVLGAQLIQDSTKDNITAETSRLQATAQSSVLTATVHTVATGFKELLKFAAFWAGDDPTPVEVRLNQDFIETRLAPQEVQAMVAAWQAGAISRLSLHEQLQRGEIIPPDRTVEEEQALDAPATGLADGHRHAVVEGRAIAATPDGEPLDHIHEIEVGSTVTELIDGHQHALVPTATNAGPEQQKTVLNGAQIASMVQVVEAVAAGRIPLQSGRAILEVALQVPVEQTLRFFDPAFTARVAEPSRIPLTQEGTDDATGRDSEGG